MKAMKRCVVALGIGAMMMVGPAFALDQEKCGEAIKDLEKYNAEMKQQVVKKDKILDQLVKLTKDKEFDQKEIDNIKNLIKNYLKMDKKFEKGDKAIDALEKKLNKDCEL